MEIHLVKTLGPVLKAADPQAAEALKSWAAGEVVTAKVRKERNGKFHRLVMALLNMVFENQERYTDFDAFRKACLIEAGFYVDRELLDGTVVREAKSMSYAAMDEVEFRRCFQALLDVIREHFLPHMSDASIEREVESYLYGWS